MEKIMNTLFLLMAEFNTPNIELSAVSQKYFGMSPATAEAERRLLKAVFQGLPVVGPGHAPGGACVGRLYEHRIRKRVLYVIFPPRRFSHCGTRAGKIPSWSFRTWSSAM